MSTYDIEQGILVNLHLLTIGVETPMVEPAHKHIPPLSHEVGLHYQQIMEKMGLDLKDDSLRDTPSRIGKMYESEIFTGLDYANWPKCTVVKNKMQYDELISVDGINVMSMCEHHFLPFIGTATVAYIPDQWVLGLSKFNRVVDFFSRRPQIQERLTAQIAHALSLVLDTEDVAVVINADHYCVKLRGVKDQGSKTVTSKVMGKFKSVPALRAEFLALSGKK